MARVEYQCVITLPVDAAVVLKRFVDAGIEKLGDDEADIHIDTIVEAMNEIPDYFVNFE